MRTLTKDFLQRWYLVKGLSTWAIEKRFGLTRSRVYSALKKHNISPRSLAQSHIRYTRRDFSGDPLEKAYLTGFTIGDLRVRNHNGPQSDTISIGCGSTRLEQIKLIEELFSRYGRVWKGKPDKRGAINIEAFVNKSFSFLLPSQRSYTTFLKTREEFFSFLAGFTDAEGSFFISRNQAFVSWGNYDMTVLRFIKNSLEKFGIETPKIYRDALKGHVGTHGYARSKNYFHLSCSRKAMVWKLLQRLQPYISHEAKKRSMVRLYKNLILRGVSS